MQRILIERNGLGTVKVPILFMQKMIAKETIQKLLTAYFEENHELFLVEVKNSPDNKIKVFIDSKDKLAIEDCVTTSRWLESQLDREEEDFELQVSSAGIGNPFKVPQQYEKALCKQVEVSVKDGRKLHGTLVSFDEENLKIEVSKKVVVEGKKKKEIIQEVETIPFSEINATKEVITF